MLFNEVKVVNLWLEGRDKIIYLTIYKNLISNTKPRIISHIPVVAADVSSVVVKKNNSHHQEQQNDARKGGWQNQHLQRHSTTVVMPREIPPLRITYKLTLEVSAAVK